MEQKISRLAPRAPPENGLVERNWRTPFLRCFLSFYFILGELCRGLVLVSSPVAKCTYKQHRYRNKCIATGPIYAWALSASGVSPPLRKPSEKWPTIIEENNEVLLPVSKSIIWYS